MGVRSGGGGGGSGSGSGPSRDRRDRRRDRRGTGDEDNEGEYRGEEGASRSGRSSPSSRVSSAAGGGRAGRRSGGGRPLSGVSTTPSSSDYRYDRYDRTYDDDEEEEEEDDDDEEEEGNLGAEGTEDVDDAVLNTRMRLDDVPRRLVKILFTNKERVVEACRRLDGIGDGFLSRKQYKQCLTRVGIAMSALDLRKVYVEKSARREKGWETGERERRELELCCLW